MTQITKHSSVKGSLQSQANKLQITVAQAFLDCQMIVCLDVSPSMTNTDCLEGQSRFKVAVNQLAKLQSENPGKVGLVCWSDSQSFLPSGVAHLFGSSTDVAGLLRWLKKADGVGIDLVIISDGEPDNESAALSEARKFEGKISCIYVGPTWNTEAQDFLKRLSAVTGGQFSNNGVAGIGNLSNTVAGYLAA